jgi:small-conductance mechanosensitive channel
MSELEPLKNLIEILSSNLNNILFTIISIALGYFVFRIISRQINKLETIQEHVTYTFNRIFKWLIIFIVFSVILGQFGITLGTISGLVALLGSTVLGFASINTLGNAIAGLIVMISRPFEVGDRIYFKNQFADIKGIELIYTKMLTLDNVLISVPNQELLKSETENYGRKKIIRRYVKVTPGYNYTKIDVEKALLEAADRVDGVLKEPKPYVWITNFLNNAVEYTLYVFINEVTKLREIEAELFDTVFETCTKHKIDIRTPVLVQSVSGGSSYPPS